MSHTRKDRTTPDFLTHFEAVEDPRQAAKVAYPLDEVLILVLCAVISGADGWTSIALYGEKKLQFGEPEAAHIRIVKEECQRVPVLQPVYVVETVAGAEGEGVGVTGGRPFPFALQKIIAFAAFEIYRVYSKTRKFWWVMTLKLSVTWSRKVFQSFGMVSRKNAGIALAKCVWVG